MIDTNIKCAIYLGMTSVVVGTRKNTLKYVRLNLEKVETGMPLFTNNFTKIVVTKIFYYFVKN